MIPKSSTICQKVQTEIGIHVNTDLSEFQKERLKQHLLDCSACQSVYEQMWHTSLVLDDLSTLSPPADLLSKTQTQIRQIHRQKKLAFFANPVSWLFRIFHLDPPPTLVIYTAVVFYVVVTAFFVRLAVLDDDSPVNLTTKPLPAKTRLVQLGAIKRAALDSVSVEDIPRTDN